MADERLRLVAEVADQFSGPLDKLNTALRRTASTGTQTAKDIAKDFDGFHGTLGKATSALQGMLSPLQSLGVVGLGAGLGLGGIATALRSFSSGTQQLTILSKETGLAVNELRAFGALGERFGATADTMQGGVKRFSDEMSQLRRRYGEAYSGLQAMNLGELVEKLVNAPNMKAALDAAMDALSNIGDPVRRRKVAEMLFGTDQIGAVAGQVTGKYQEMMKEIQNQIGSMSKETEQAAIEFEKNMSRMGNAAERLKITTFGPLLKGLNTIVESGDRKGIRGNAEAMEADLTGQLSAKTKERDELKSRPVINSEQIKALEKEIARLTDAMRRAKDPAGPSGVSAIPMSYSGGGGSGAAKIYTASYGGGGGFGGGMGVPSPGLGGFGGPLPTLGGGYGGSLSGGGGSGAGGGRRLGGLDADAGPLSSAADASTPRGNGAGSRGGARTADMMRYAMDQLRREGVPEGNLRQAAAHLVGQAHMESGLDPNKIHDGGTGYGIYGARDPNPGRGRRTDMLNWLKSHGYAPNSAEGQMREMVHRAMSGRYRQTRRILMGQGSGDVERDTNAITREFESPAIVNQRSGAVRNANRVGPSVDPEGAASASSGENGNFPNGAPRALKPLSMADDPKVPGQVVGRDNGAGKRPGDALMQRLYGDQAPVARSAGKGTMDITLHGFPAGAKARTSMDDLFKEVNISKSRQMETTSL